MHRIIIQIETTRGYLPSAVKLRRWAKTALSHKTRHGELCIRIVGKKEIQDLNKTYRNKDKPTNVLSFRSDLPAEIQETIPLLGDIVICADVVNKEAKEQDKLPEAHWAHMIVHGTLHILGFDHEKASEAQIMEAKEVKLLKNLGFNNPY